jgi:hypothetical protein
LGLALANLNRFANVLALAKTDCFPFNIPSLMKCFWSHQDKISAEKFVIEKEAQSMLDIS